MSTGSTIVLFSGGLDSTLCCHIAKRDAQLQKRDDGFSALFVNYGQTAAELEMVRAAAAREKWELVCASVTPFPKSLDPAGTNYIAGRNAMFFALAAGMLGAEGGTVYIGSNADDYKDYPDCRLEFFHAVEKLSDGKLNIQAPLINKSKLEVMKEALRRGIKLADTLSCYQPTWNGNSWLHCGECNACVLRLKAQREVSMR